MLIYIILSSIASVILSYYLLNIANEENTNDFVYHKGAWKFYALSALLGPAIIPIVFGAIIYVLFIEK